MVFQNDIRVYDVVITPSMVNKVVNALKARGSFTATNVTTAFRELGVPEQVGDGVHLSYVASRAADRTIQKMSKLGMIQYGKSRQWHWVEGH